MKKIISLCVFCCLIGGINVYSAPIYQRITESDNIDSLELKDKIASLKEGDVIYYHGAFNIDYFHHSAVFVGDIENDGNQYVIEHGFIASITNIQMKKTPFYEFIARRGGQFEIMDFSKYYPELKSKSRAEIVKTALYLLNNQQKFKKYDPLKNNCQHFVTYCVFGVKKSWQAPLIELLYNYVLDFVVNFGGSISSSMLFEQALF